MRRRWAGLAPAAPPAASAQPRTCRRAALYGTRKARQSLLACT